MGTIRAIVKRVVYYNNENGFIIISATSDSQSEAFTIKGNSVRLDTELPIVCEGEWIQDKKFGSQFKATSIKAEELKEENKILQYLSSGAIKGIGKKTAEKIVAHFKENTLEILDENINELEKVSGIGANKIKTIRESWIEKRASQYIMTELLSYNISYSNAIKIFSKYKEETINVLNENPYKLIYDIRSIGFETADKIALKMGKEKDDAERILSALIYIIKRDERQYGNTCIERENLLDQARGILNIYDWVAEVLDLSVKHEHIIESQIDDKKYYLDVETDFYEQVIANKIKDILLNKERSKIEKENINDYFKNTKFPYSDEQKEAVSNIFKDNISIMTGGPGVGKTTVLKSIIDIIVSKHKRKDILNLASPTGKAAQRMAESTNMEAKTIHRLLEFDPESGGFKKNKYNLLDAKFVIIDESSMIDLWLFSQLINAISSSAHLIIIGDADQLPSVGHGAILRDLIESGEISVNELTVIRRQAEGSNIIVNAHAVNSGDFFNKNEKDSDFYYIKTSNDQQTLDKILSMINQNIPDKFGFKTENDIQILTPMHKGALGTQNLNMVFQKIFNKNVLLNAKKIEYGDKIYYEGDKIIQTKNNYEKMIFNGDSATIIEINGNYIVVDFDGVEVELTKNELADVNHFYAGTIHKSQGSEYPVVIIPITSAYTPMLDRSLLYTGITRGKKLVIVIGNAQSIDIAIQNKNAKSRKTMLKEKIIQVMKKT